MSRGARSGRGLVRLLLVFVIGLFCAFANFVGGFFIRRYISFGIQGCGRKVGGSLMEIEMLLDVRD